MKKYIPLLYTVAYILSFFIIYQFGLPETVKEKINNHNVIENSSFVYDVVPYNVVKYTALETFSGTLTGYGPDCVGCGGHTGCPPAQDVTNGNIYYDDIYYGKLRIVASDASLSCGSVVRITANKVFEKPVLAIVLDRGSQVKGKKFDLLYESEAAASGTGLQRDVKYEVLRYGWQ